MWNLYIFVFCFDCYRTLALSLKFTMSLAKAKMQVLYIVKCKVEKTLVNHYLTLK